MPMQATTTAPLFAAQLTPHRSLSPRGMRFVIGLVAALAALPGLIFFSLGRLAGRRLHRGSTCSPSPGPCTPRCARASGASRSRLWPDRLEVRHHRRQGHRNGQRLQPQDACGWSSTAISTSAPRRCMLRTAQGETEIGAFLGPDDRSSFAKAFGTALRKARGCNARSASKPGRNSRPSGVLRLRHHEHAQHSPSPRPTTRPSAPPSAISARTARTSSTCPASPAPSG